MGDRLATINIGRKEGDGVPIYHSVAWTEVYHRANWHLDPSSHLATIDMSRKWGVLCPSLGGAGSPSNTMSPEPRPTSIPSGILIHPTVSRQQTWAKIWRLCPFGGPGSPTKTMWPGSRPISVPSGILIHPAVWP